MTGKNYSPIQCDLDCLKDGKRRRFVKGVDFLCRPRDFVKALQAKQAEVSSVLDPIGLYAKVTRQGDVIAYFHPLTIEEGDKPYLSPNMLRVYRRDRALAAIREEMERQANNGSTNCGTKKTGDG